MSKKAVIAIHGGTSGLDLAKAEFDLRSQAMKEALNAGEGVLASGGSALDAVVAAVCVMEDAPCFNAGLGAVYTKDGYHELDACVSCGSSARGGAVGLCRHIKNPVLAARYVMERTKHCLLAGEGADAFARECGLCCVDQEYFHTANRYQQLQEFLAKEHKSYLGTVGAVALDEAGKLAAATSTGGITGKMSGRIGDSAIIGAGNYADTNIACSCTGTGDVFMRLVAGHELASLYKYEGKSLAISTKVLIQKLIDLGGSGGVVSVDKDGELGFAWSSSSLGLYHGMQKVHEDAQVFWPLKSS